MHIRAIIVSVIITFSGFGVSQQTVWKKFESESKKISVSLPVGEDSPNFIVLALPNESGEEDHPGNRMHGQEGDVFYLFDYAEYPRDIDAELINKLINMYTEGNKRECKKISLKGVEGTECKWKTEEANGMLRIYPVKRCYYAQVVFRPFESSAPDNTSLFFNSFSLSVQK